MGLPRELRRIIWLKLSGALSAKHHEGIVCILVTDGLSFIKLITPHFLPGLAYLDIRTFFGLSETATPQYILEQLPEEVRPDVNDGSLARVMTTLVHLRPSLVTADV